MSAKQNSSRRDFLGTAAAALGAAGLVSVPGRSSAGESRRQGRLQAVAGPRPKQINPDRPIRLGLIGVGGRCNDLLNATAAAKSNVQIVAIADPNEANVKARLNFIRQTWNAMPEVYTGEQDYRDKLLARDDVDAVLIATPCLYHAEMYVAAFAAGKHLYGEKPMCIEVDEVNAIVDAQKKNPDVICQIGFQRRASKGYQAAVQKMHGGLLGRMFEATGGWRISGGPLGMPGSGTQIWFGRRRLSGDWMLEQACHTWDVFCWVAGEMPIAASGRGQRGLFKEQDPERDVTDFYVAHLEFPSGLIADFEHNWMCPKHDDQMRFQGVFERFVGTSGGVALSTWPGEATFYPRDEKEKVVQYAKPLPEPTQESIEAFYHALRTNTKPPSGVENGRMATLTGMLVRKAVYENRRVEMKELTGA